MIPAILALLGKILGLGTSLSEGGNAEIEKVLIPAQDMARTKKRMRQAYFQLQHRPMEQAADVVQEYFPLGDGYMPEQQEAFTRILKAELNIKN